MNTKGFALTVALLGLLVALPLALPAQAQDPTCAQLESYSFLYDHEQVWYDRNCVEEEDDDDDDDDGQELGHVVTLADIPLLVTCPTLPPSIAVFGYSDGTQCQVVDGAGIGKMELVKRGVISAVDVWGFVNGGVEVCFRNSGSLVFLDADYAPRMLMELETYQRDGMTCGAIDRAGTVVLLESPPAPDPAPTTEPAASALPLFDAIPLSNCFIKLVETLFLRAEPAGEIIGLVWINSEVSAFEINGYWYKIEFEGKTGYISRYHRRVLRGGCG